jgi:hypothetical protein
VNAPASPPADETRGDAPGSTPEPAPGLEPAPAPARKGWRAWAAPGALLLYVLAYYGSTALRQAGLFERDGYYHARLARLLPERWFSREFPWTQLSTWKDGFCDKEVVYHLAMAPFAWIGPEPITGARIFAVLLAATVVAGLYALLRRWRVPWPAFFAALPLATGGLFLARLGMIRSHVLSMALLVLGLHLLLGRRWRALAVLGFAYAWCYTVPFVLLLTAVPFAVGRWLGRDPFDWRSVVAAGGGAVAGLVIHPYSPLTLETFFTYVQVFRLGVAGADSTGFELGNEIYAYSPAVFLDIYPLVVILVPLVTLGIALAWRRATAETKGAVAAMLFWAAMTATAPRFVEYLALVLAVASGLLVRDLAAAPDALPRWLPRGKGWRAAGAVVALAVLVGFHVRSAGFDRVYQFEHAPARFFDGAGAWMAANLRPGETVVNLYWDDFPDLFYSAPRQHYLWGLDPTYSIRYDAARSRYLERARRRQVLLDGHVLRHAFGSSVLVLRASRADAYTELRAPPFREVYRDGSAVVYRID